MTSNKILMLIAIFYVNTGYGLTNFGCWRSSIQETSKDVLEAAYFGAKDNRRNIDEFAQEEGLEKSDAEALFSNTGTIICNGGKLSGQIVGNNSTVLTSAHGLYDSNCRPRKLEECFFETSFGVKQKLLFDASKSLIKPCTKPGRNFDHANDWAVLTLQTPAEKVIPARILSRPQNMKYGSALLQVSAYAKDYQRPSFSRCRVLGTDLSVKNSPFLAPAVNNCAADIGSSGSGQYVKNFGGRWELVGILSGIPKGFTNGMTPNIEKGQVNISTTIQGELWEELNRRSKEN